MSAGAFLLSCDAALLGTAILAVTMSRSGAATQAIYGASLAISGLVLRIVWSAPLSRAERISRSLGPGGT